MDGRYRHDQALRQFREAVVQAHGAAEFFAERGIAVSRRAMAEGVFLVTMYRGAKQMRLELAGAGAETDQGLLAELLISAHTPSDPDDLRCDWTRSGYIKPSLAFRLAVESEAVRRFLFC